MCGHQVRSYVPNVTTEDHTKDSSRRASAADEPAVPHYEVRVEGHLASRWATWFDGLSLSCEDDGTTVIRGPVVDQAALHGLLQKLRDVGIPLISLTPLTDDATQPRTLRHQEGN
jgi:hypothetical protein